MFALVRVFIIKTRIGVCSMRGTRFVAMVKLPLIGV